MKQTKPQDFRALVLKAMKEQGLSARDLAHFCYPVDQRTVERWLKGQHDTLSATIAAMLHVLGLEVVQRKPPKRNPPVV